MRKKIIIGNWKMNKTKQEVKNFITEFKQLLEENKDKITNMMYGVAPTFTYLDFAKALAIESGLNEFIISAQNASAVDAGARTSEISTDMLTDINVQAVILGHSEVRTFWNETDKIVNEKTHNAISKGLLPIVCVGETLEQYEAGETKQIIETQIKGSLEGITDWSKVVIAYEPIWAIGTGKTATAADAEEIIAFIRSITNPDVLIQYGGSVKPENVEELLSQPNIDGALVGGASLDPKSFIKLLTLNK